MDKINTRRFRINNDKEDYLHGHYITPDIDESEITVFKGFVEEDIVKIIYIYEKNTFKSYA